jgi:3-hydroxybutyrate dehydrogenase
VYAITKYGGEAFSDILRLEMRKFGVKVIIVEPGNFSGITGILSPENVCMKYIQLFQCEKENIV